VAGWVVPVAVAFITAVVGPMLLVWRQHRHDLEVLRRENSAQHNEGHQLLQTIHSDLRLVHKDLGKIDGRTEAVVEAVEDVRRWVLDHEVRHAVEDMKRGTD
jgi:hypothetical protein